MICRAIVIIQASPSEWAENEEIKLYREYLRIPTVQPNVNYSKKKEHRTIFRCSQIPILISHFRAGCEVFETASN